MRIKDALANIHKEHVKDTLNPLCTVWGEQLDGSNPWQEYPRPQWQRAHYQMLHGEWEYAIVPINGEYEFESQGKIIVPFSPETLLSGVERQLQPNEYLWYQRSLVFEEKEIERKGEGWRCLLHFDAVDQQAVVYINHEEVAQHYGGYLPFAVDVTDYVSEQGCVLQVRVQDDSDTSYHTRGKQTLKRGGMFYTAQSGIWQSVWYEWVPENYVKAYRITPDYDNSKVELELFSNKKFSSVHMEMEEASFDITVAETKVEEEWRTTLTVQFKEGEFSAWSPENPYLYHFALRAGED